MAKLLRNAPPLYPHGPISAEMGEKTKRAIGRGEREGSFKAPPAMEVNAVNSRGRLETGADRVECVESL